MSLSVSNVQGSNQIVVKSMKGLDETFTYSAADTIQILKQKITESMGIPPEQQRLYAHYDITNFWRSREITNPDALMVNELQHVNYIRLFLKLRGH